MHPRPTISLILEQTLICGEKSAPQPMMVSDAPLTQCQLSRTNQLRPGNEDGRVVAETGTAALTYPTATSRRSFLEIVDAR